jgi:exo-beta-1,3-glucanase (GH17 family)
MRKRTGWATWLCLGIGLASMALGCANPSGGTKLDTTKVTIRPLPTDFSTRKAVAYEGYRGTTGPGTSSGAPTQADIDQDLTILKTAGYGLLRVFNSGTDGVTELVIKRIKALGYDMKLQLGIWITGPKSTDDALNQTEIAAGIALANTYPEVVETVSVGNERLVNWTYIDGKANNPMPALDLQGYIAQVRAAIKQPVTTDDNWAFFADSSGATSGGPGTGSYATDLILGAIDYVSMHSYAFSDAAYGLWDYKQAGASNTDGTTTSPSSRVTAMMDAAIAAAKANYTAVQSYLSAKGYNMPIVIGETGWKAWQSDSNSPTEQFMAHPVNQKLYLDRLAAWTGGPNQIFYFEAFDETWKYADDGWGLFDVNRHARFALYSYFTTATTVNGITVPGNETTVDSKLAYDYTSALCYVPQAVNGTITANNYLTLADSLTADSTTAVPVGGTSWYGWDANPPTATGGAGTGGSVPDGDSSYEKITTASKSWGWGFFQMLNNMDDLRNFSSGHLTFYMRTSYPGKLYVGYATGSTTDSTQGQAFAVLSSNDGSGFVSDGAWHLVSLALSGISYWNKGSSGAPSAPDLTKVSWPLFVADTFASYGNYAGTGDTQAATTGQEIDIAHICWTQN